MGWLGKTSLVRLEQRLAGGEGGSWGALWGNIKQGGGNNKWQVLIQGCAFMFPEELGGREPGGVW